MAGRRQSATAQARERARRAKAALDAERAERELSLEQLVTDFYLCDAHARDAVTAAEAAELRRARAVVAILDLEDAARTARLCGLNRSDVIRLRRAVAKAQDSPSTSDSRRAAHVADEVAPHAAAAGR